VFNSQNEEIQVIVVPSGPHKGSKVLAVFDDKPSKIVAYHLLDTITVDFLLEELKKIKSKEYKHG